MNVEYKFVDVIRVRCPRCHRKTWFQMTGYNYNISMHELSLTFTCEGQYSGSKRCPQTLTFGTYVPEDRRKPS